MIIITGIPWYNNNDDDNDNYMIMTMTMTIPIIMIIMYIRMEIPRIATKLWFNAQETQFGCICFIMELPLLVLMTIYVYDCVDVTWWQGWGQIRFIKYKYKYKYKNLDFSNTNTNTNIFFNFDSNTNTNTSIQIQVQIQICSTKYICRNCSVSKIGQFCKSQDICSWPVFPYV